MTVLKHDDWHKNKTKKKTKEKYIINTFSFIKQIRPESQKKKKKTKLKNPCRVHASVVSCYTTPQFSVQDVGPQGGGGRGGRGMEGGGHHVGHRVKNVKDYCTTLSQ